jgi:hypothetical protein
VSASQGRPRSPARFRSNGIDGRGVREVVGGRQVPGAFPSRVKSRIQGAMDSRLQSASVDPASTPLEPNYFATMIRGSTTNNRARLPNAFDAPLSPRRHAPESQPTPDRRTGDDISSTASALPPWQNSRRRGSTVDWGGAPPHRTRRGGPKTILHVRRCPNRRAFPLPPRSPTLSSSSICVFGRRSCSHITSSSIWCTSCPFWALGPHRLQHCPC